MITYQIEGISKIFDVFLKNILYLNIINMRGGNCRGFKRVVERLRGQLLDHKNTLVEISTKHFLWNGGAIS